MYENYCKLRDLRGYKDADVVRGTGVTKSTFSDWKNGRSEPGTDKMIKIAKFLNTSVEYLKTGENSEVNELALTGRDNRDIAKRLESTLSDLESDQSALMFSGEPLDEETRELLKASLENSLKIAKINAKQKFTPKKYRKDN